MKTERFSITHTLPVSPALVSCWASCCLYQQTHTEQIQTSLSTSSRLCSCNKLFINLTRVKVLSLTVTLSKVLADSNDLQVSCLLTHRWPGSREVRKRLQLQQRHLAVRRSGILHLLFGSGAERETDWNKYYDTVAHRHTPLLFERAFHSSLWVLTCYLLLK